MLILPKIQDNMEPLKRQYLSLIESKVNKLTQTKKEISSRIVSSKMHSNLKIKDASKDIKNPHFLRRILKSSEQTLSTRFNWIKSQIYLVQPILNQQLFEELIKFQSACKDRNIPSSYSYFTLKSILNKLYKLMQLEQSQKQKINQNQEKKGNKQMQVLEYKNNEQMSHKNNKNSINETVDLLQTQTKNILKETSFYDKIQSFINLREDILENLQKNYEAQSYNLLFQNVNDIKFLNFQIIQNIKHWKQHLLKLQTNQSEKQSLSIIQSMFYFGQENYLSKIVNDNANVISFVNKKDVHFISPPNPFFLTQDGNKQGMSMHQQQKIQTCMQILAKQKGLQLKMLISPPQFYKSKYGVKFYESAKLKEQNNKRTTFSQAKKQSYSNKNLSPYLNSNRLKSSSILSKNQSSKFIFQNESLKNQAQFLSLKTDRPSSKKLAKLDSNQKIKLLKFQNTKQSYIQKISSLKLQVQKGKNIKISPKRQQISKVSQKNIIQKVEVKQQKASIIKKQYNSSIPRSLAQIKTVKPKIRLVAERQTSINNPIDAILDPLSKLFLVKQSQKEKQQKKQILKNSSSSFYKKCPKIQQVDQQADKHQPTTHSKIKRQKNKNQKSANLSMSKLSQAKLVDIKQSSQKLKSSTQTNFLYSKPRSSLDLKIGLNKYQKQAKSLKKQTKQTKQANLEKSELQIYKKQQSLNQKQKSQQKIDNQLLNLKNRLRDLTIMKVYGKKQRIKKSVEEQNSKQKIKFGITQSKLSKDLKSSPYKKRQNYKLIQRRKKSKQQNKQSLQSSIIYKNVENQKSKDFFNQQSRISQKQKQLSQQYLIQQQQVQERLQKLQKRKQLISQSNKMKQTQILLTNKKKSTLQTQFMEKQKKLKQLQQRIQQFKQKKKQKGLGLNYKKSISSIKSSDNMNKSDQMQEAQKQDSQYKIEESSLFIKQQDFKQKQAQISQLKNSKQAILQQNKLLSAKMKDQQQRFIKLKESQYKLREESIMKKHNAQLQLVKQEYKLRQKQFQEKVLQQQRKRKQNQIVLMKRKRQTELMKIKLQQQELKEALLLQILNQQKQKQILAQKEEIQFKENIKQKIQQELKEKQQIQNQFVLTYQNEKNKLQIIYQQMKNKNKQIQQQNKKRLQQIERIQKQKEIQTQKLLQLKSNINTKEEQNNQKAIILQKLNQEMASMTQNQNFSEGDLEQMKLKLKQQILQQILKRKKKQEEEQLAYEQERRKHVQEVQQQIKLALRKQDQQIQKQLQLENTRLKLNQQRKKEMEKQRLVQVQNRQKQQRLEIQKQIQERQQSQNEIIERQKLPRQREKGHNEQMQKQQRQKNIKQYQQQGQNKEHTKDIQRQNLIKKEKQRSDNSKLIQQAELVKVSNTKQKVNYTKQNSSEKLKQQTLQIVQKINLKQESISNNKVQQIKQNDQPHQIIEQNINKQLFSKDKIKQVQKQELLVQNIKQNEYNQQSIQKNDLKIKQQTNKIVQYSQIQSPPNSNQIKKQVKNQKQTQFKKQRHVAQQQSKSKDIENNFNYHTIDENTKHKGQNYIEQPNKKVKQTTKLQEPSNKQSPSKLPVQRQESPSKVQQNPVKDSQSVKQSIIQSSQQILHKYEALQAHISRKTKYVFIQENQIQQYLISFFSFYSIQVKQMFPFKKQELLSILKNRGNKIDIFDCHSIGWLDQTTNKYSLIGSLQCCELIAKKYGQIQIQQIYLFTKQNPYQKQYLIKQIKVFQSVGYIYQKKLKDQNIYSIKFIIKIPNQVVDKNSRKNNDSINVYSSICFQNIDKLQSVIQHGDSLSGILIEALKNNLSQNQFKNLPLTSTDISTNFILKKISERFTQTVTTNQNSICRPNIIDDNNFQFDLNIKLNYLTTKQQNLFALSAKQIKLKNKSQTTVYLCKIPKMENYKIFIQEVKISEANHSTLDLQLQNFAEQINSQKQQNSSQRDLSLYLPIFSINKVIHYNNGIGLIKPFVFRSKFTPKLVGSSIKFSNFSKEQFKFMSPRGQFGFIFAIFESNSNQLLNKAIWGTVVTASDLQANENKRN